MDLELVMQQVSDRLDTITGLRCFPYPVDKATPPWAMVGLPEEIRFDGTYQRGLDRMKLPLVVGVQRVPIRNAVKALAAYCTGAGPRSVKQVLESGTYTAFDVVVVESVDDISPIKLGEADHLAALFVLGIGGSGT